MMTPEDTERLTQAVADIAGAQVGLEAEGDRVVLTGLVESPEQRQAVLDIIASMNPKLRVQDFLEVEVMDIGLTETLTYSEGATVEPPSELDENQEDGGAEPEFPSTDPVVTLDDSGQVQVLGGFSETSLDSVEVDRSSGDGPVGDLALAEAVQRELHEDAATTSLHVGVHVAQGVA